MSKTRTWRPAWAAAAAVAVAFAAAPNLRADVDTPADKATQDPTISFERYTLDNGLEVILHQDNSVPLVAVDVWYHVGAGNERPGKSGFAHLFEHMLFQGSEHTGEDAHFSTLRAIGASSVNGSTTFDRTNYFEVVPSNQLETALWLESDRMGYFLPGLTQDSLDNQIGVVRNERRQNYDNRPYGKTRFAVNAALYPEGHPYRYLVIGRHEDLTSATLTDVRNFYKTWYVPANATLVLAGDFEVETAKKLVDKWFGSFPKTQRAELTPPPPPALEKTVRVTVEDDFARLRRIQYHWHAPARFGEGEAELDILANALSAAGTGRLYKILVHEKQLAQSVFAYHYGSGFSGQFVVGVSLKGDADLAEVESIVNAELMKVIREPIDAVEHNRAVIRREASFVWGLESVLSRAETLQSYNHYVGKPDFITEDLDRFRTSSPEKVRDVAAKWLSKPRAEILTVPATAAATEGK